MNRREFVASAITIGVAIVLPGTSMASGGLPSVAKRMSMYEHVWLHHLRLQLHAGKDVIYATSTQKNAMRVYNLLDRHPHLHCTSIGGAIHGRRADLIAIDDFADYETHASSSMRARYKDWFNCSLRTRLVPDADPIMYITS